MKSTPRRLLVRTTVFLLCLGAAAGAVFSIAPAGLRDIAGMAFCQSRLVLAGATPSPCAAPGSPPTRHDDAAPFDAATAFSVQAEARSIAEAFGPTPR